MVVVVSVTVVCGIGGSCCSGTCDRGSSRVVVVTVVVD